MIARCLPHPVHAGLAALRRRSDPHVCGRPRAAALHIDAPDFEVLVRISDLAVIAGEARPGQIQEALRWALLERAALMMKWTELNERG